MDAPNLPLPELESQLEYLAQFVTDARKARIEHVLAHRTRHIAIGLENIYQPQNASAVLRTADCFGIQDIHSIENTNNFYISTRVTHGADKWVDTYRHREEDGQNTQRCIDHLRGHPLFGHVTLTRSERSPVAALVAGLLDGHD